MVKKKKVGNACRTRGQISSSKNKGSSFEYDVQYSLEQHEDVKSVTRTAERGYQRQFDLLVNFNNNPFETAIECKNHKQVTWNQLVKLYEMAESICFLMKYLLSHKNPERPICICRRSSR